MRGGRRAGSGRKKGQTIKRTQAIVEGALAEGISPLQYMLQVLRSSDADMHRRDEMARASAAFVHPKLNAVASLDASANSYGPLEIKIFSVPRGSTFDSKKGLFPCPEGSRFEPEPFPPSEPTPALPALTDQSAAPATLEPI